MDNLNPVLKIQLYIQKHFITTTFQYLFWRGLAVRHNIVNTTQIWRHFCIPNFFNDLRETDRTCHRLPLIFLTKKMALSKTFLNTFFFQNYLHIVMIYFRENKFETVSFALLYGLWSFRFNNFAIAIYEFPKIIVRSRKIIAEFPNSE